MWSSRCFWCTFVNGEYRLLMGSTEYREPFPGQSTSIFSLWQALGKIDGLGLRTRSGLWCCMHTAHNHVGPSLFLKKSWLFWDEFFFIALLFSTSSWSMFFMMCQKTKRQNSYAIKKDIKNYIVWNKCFTRLVLNVCSPSVALNQGRTLPPATHNKSRVVPPIGQIAQKNKNFARPGSNSNACNIRLPGCGTR